MSVEILRDQASGKSLSDAKKLEFVGDTERASLSRLLREGISLSKNVSGDSVAFQCSDDEWDGLSRAFDKTHCKSLILQRSKAGGIVTVAPLGSAAGMTIVITTYESDQKKLRRCLNSVADSAELLIQVGGSVELLVCDDCSSNSSETEDLVREIGSRFSTSEARFIKWQRNRGVSSSRSNALANAKFDRVIFVDHDDSVEPAHLLFIAAEFDRGAHVVAVDMSLPASRYFCSWPPSDIPHLFFENAYGAGIAINRNAPLVLEILARGDLYNSRQRFHYEDWELHVLFALLKVNVVLLPLATYVYDLSTSGRDSRNTVHKLSSSLGAPQNAIERFAILRPELAFEAQRDYALVLKTRLEIAASAELSLLQSLALVFKRHLQRLDTQLFSQAGGLGLIYKRVRPFFIHTVRYLRHSRNS